MAVDLRLDFDSCRTLKPNPLPFLLLSMCPYFSLLSQDPKCVHPKAVCLHCTSTVLSLLPEYRYSVTNHLRLLRPHTPDPAPRLPG